MNNSCEFCVFFPFPKGKCRDAWRGIKASLCPFLLLLSCSAHFSKCGCPARPFVRKRSYSADSGTWFHFLRKSTAVNRSQERFYPFLRCFFLWQWMLCMQTNLSRKSDSARLWQIPPKNPPCAQSFWYTERYCAACLSCQAAHCAVTKKKRRGKGERAQNRFGRCSAAEACEACANRVGSGVQKQSFRTESV